MNFQGGIRRLTNFQHSLRSVTEVTFQKIMRHQIYALHFCTQQLKFNLFRFIQIIYLIIT